jgi:N-acetylmuramoyl-L-alanine amidase
MTPQDIAIGALCAWRENRGGGREGMQSVINVLVNRAAHRASSVYAEAVRPWQFSSMTATGDPNLVLFPTNTDAQFAEALALMQQAAEGSLTDITGGALYYYAKSMKTPPPWAARMTPTAEIQGQRFFA